MSPDKKPGAGSKRAAPANNETDSTVRVEELAESDMGYLSDVSVIYPASLEEAESRSSASHSDDDDGDDELSSSPSSSDEDGAADGDTRSDPAGLARRLSRLRCKDEAEFEARHRQRRLSKRMGSRVFKRSHSQSAKAGDAVKGGESAEGEEVDADGRDDQDVEGSRRRLRRRVRGPDGGEVVFEDVMAVGREVGGGGGRWGKEGMVRGVAPMTPEQEGGSKHGVMQDGEAEAMDVDGMS